MTQFLRIRYIPKQVLSKTVVSFLTDVRDFWLPVRESSEVLRIITMHPFLYFTTPIIRKVYLWSDITLCWNLSLLFLSALPQPWKTSYSPTLIDVSEIFRDCSSYHALFSSLSVFFPSCFFSDLFFRSTSLFWILAHKHPSYGTEATSKHFTSLCGLLAEVRGWQGAVEKDCAAA